MKKLIMLLLCITMLTIVLTACDTEIAAKPNEDLPIIYSNASYVIDVENPHEVVGSGDYVFVAQINEELETVHRNIKEINNKKTSMPYTVYSITVIDEIKGTLKKNTPIQFEKFGGVNISRDSISLLEGDTLFEEGEYYILIASGQPDGRIVQSGPTAAIKLGVESKNEIVSSQEYKDYKKIYNEEIKIERTRYKSKYEE